MVRKEKGGVIGVKIDLEKAYDRIEWDFLRRVLYFFNFPRQWVKLVMECMCASRVWILVNRSQMDVIEPSRGLKQGDPLSLSLYLFYLVHGILEHQNNIGM